MLNTNKYSIGFLQDIKSFLAECEDSGITSIHGIEDIINYAVSTFTSERRLRKPNTQWNIPCPSCGKGNLTKVLGISELVLICKECRYSEYKG